MLCSPIDDTVMITLHNDWPQFLLGLRGIDVEYKSPVAHDFGSWCGCPHCNAVRAEGYRFRSLRPTASRRRVGPRGGPDTDRAMRMAARRAAYRRLEPAPRLDESFTCSSGQVADLSLTRQEIGRFAYVPGATPWDGTRSALYLR